MNARIMVLISILYLWNQHGRVFAQIQETESETTSVKTEAVTEESKLPSVIERSSHAHVRVNTGHKGFWRKKFAWNPRWVKTWQEKKVYVAVWKRMWGPMMINEWVPVPKPPPGWVKHDTSYIVKRNPHS